MSGDRKQTIPDVGEGKRGEAGYVGYLLRQASAATRLATERAMADLGVTHPQFLVMTMVNAYPGCSSADVARLTMLTPQTISLIVGNLESAGRLARTPSASHGRVQEMALTEAGVALLAECRRRTQAIEATIVAHTDPDLLRHIRRWLVDVAALEYPAPEPNLSKRPPV